MTRPLLAILLLLPLSVSAGDEARLLTDEEARAALEGLWQGELDGKALICENEGSLRFGVEFKRSQVIHYATLASEMLAIGESDRMTLKFRKPLGKLSSLQLSNVVLLDTDEHLGCYCGHFIFILTSHSKITLLVD